MIGEVEEEEVTEENNGKLVHLIGKQSRLFTCTNWPSLSQSVALKTLFEGGEGEGEEGARGGNLIYFLSPHFLRLPFPFSWSLRGQEKCNLRGGAGGEAREAEDVEQVLEKEHFMKLITQLLLNAPPSANLGTVLFSAISFAPHLLLLLLCCCSFFSSRRWSPKEITFLSTI